MIQSIDWLEFIYTNPSVNCMQDAFIHTLYYIVDECVPRCSTGRHQNFHKTHCPKHIYPKAVHKLLIKKCRLWKQYRATPQNFLLKAKIRECTYSARQLMQNFEEEHERGIINSGNVGAFYQHVNKRLSNNSGFSPLMDMQGNIISDNLAKARLLNEYFAFVGVTDNGCFPRVHHYADVSCSFNDIVFTVDNVKAAINKLKPNLSSGPDGLPPLLFKRLCTVLAIPLSLLFHQIFSVSYFPLNGSKKLLFLYTTNNHNQSISMISQILPLQM